MKNRIVTALIALLIVTQTLKAQEARIADLGSRFWSQDTLATRLQQELATMNSALQANENAMSALRKRDKLSYFEQQKLQRLLQESQQQARHIADVQQRLNEINRTRIGLGEKLVDAYAQGRAKLIRRIETEALTEKEKETILQTISQLQRRQQAVAARMPKELHGITIAQITLNPEDTAERIRLKAGLLKDQEDKLRRRHRELEEQSGSLTRELELRNRMADLTTDIALFDQRDEFTQGSESAGEASLIDAGPGVTENRQDEAGGPDRFYVGFSDLDFANLSVEQLDDVIELLNRQQKRTRAVADSLARQAQEFYRIADAK